MRDTGDGSPVPRDGDSLSPPPGVTGAAARMSIRLTKLAGESHMSRPERIDCVLFDCDGVLIDSEPIAARRNVVVFGRMGIPATFEDCLTMCGQDGKTTIPAIGAKYGIDVTAEQFFAAKRAALTKKVAAALLADGRVKLTGLYSEKTGGTYDAPAVLEDTGESVRFRLEFDKGART